MSRWRLASCVQPRGRQRIRTEMQDHVDAFRKSSVQNAILTTENGRIGKVAAKLYRWSTSGQQFVSAGWSLLDSVALIGPSPTRSKRRVAPSTA